MKQRTSSSKSGLYYSVVGVILLALFAGSIAFPGPWNSVKSVVPFWPTLSEKGFLLGLDLQGGAHLEYDADMASIPESDRAQALEGVRDVIERRVNAFGVSEPIVQTTSSGGAYRVIVELAGVQDINEAISLIGETPILEFKLPSKELSIDPTEEQQAQIDAAQEAERAEALRVLDLAKNGEDFAFLAETYSVDETTKRAGGYVGFIDEDDSVFGGLAKRIRTDRLRPGIISGLYESESAMHIVNYWGSSQRTKVEASHIIVCHAESQGCQNSRTKEEALALITEIQEKATTRNFADLAREYSEDATAEAGGELGFLAEGDTVSAFEDVLFSMRTGTISDIVETDFGYHLIYRTDAETVTTYEIQHVEMPWTTASDILDLDGWDNTGLSGEHVKSASVAFDQQIGGQPYVVLSFNPEGAKLFETITSENVGNVIGIFLDGEAISTPVVQDAIYGGEATIVGLESLAEAKLLVQRLNAGALPVPIDLVAQQQVGPTLGKVSLDQSVTAALIGFLFLAVFMVAYYRFAGLLAMLSLVVYSAINLAIYKLFGVTMTLAGIAGFVLSLGMAVDANVLIFERLREELRSGRDLSTAIDEGFRRAWTAIRDGNITTLIAAGTLFVMSTSFIKGFALTLAIGILVSMFTAIFITRIFLKFATLFKALRKNWLYNGKLS